MLGLDAESAVDTVLRTARARAEAARDTQRAIAAARETDATSRDDIAAQEEALAGAKAVIAELFRDQAQDPGDGLVATVRHLLGRGAAGRAPRACDASGEAGRGLGAA